MFVLQKVNRQPIYDISSTFNANNIPFVFWDKKTLSISDMYASFKPTILVVMEEFGRQNFDELVFAKEKYCPGNESKIAIINMSFKGDEVFGFQWQPCFNEVMYYKDELPKITVTDVALILDEDLENTHHSFALELAEMISQYSIRFRIYSNFVNHYSNVGQLEANYWRAILKYTDIIIDPRDEIGVNALIYENRYIVPQGINSTVDKILNLINNKNHGFELTEKRMTSQQQTKNLLLESGLKF